MKVTRSYLIELCDKFLDDSIDKVTIQHFAWNAIMSDHIGWDEDEIISEIIFEWDNEEINYEINKANMILSKERLLG